MKLQFKIILIIIPFVFMSILGLGYFSYITSKNFAHGSFEKYMDGMLDIYVSQSVRPQYDLLITNQLDSIPSFVESYKDDSAKLVNKLPLPWAGHFIIVTGEGEYVHTSNNMSKEQAESVWGELAKELHQGDTVKYSGYVKDVDGEEFYKVVHFDPWNWYIFVSVESDVVTASSNTIRNNTALISVITALLLSLIIIWSTRKLIVKPIHALSNAAIQIGKTRKRTEINITGHDEIGSLAVQLESMSGEIENYDEKLKDWSSDLEHQVAERTKELNEKNSLLNLEIDHRKKIQTELMDTMKRLEDMVNGTDNLVTVVGTDGKYLFVNPAAEKILGKKPEDMIGKLAFDDIFEEDREYTVNHFQSWMKDKLINTALENRLVHTDGSTRIMQWNIFMNRDKNGELQNINSIARDVTSARESEQRLVEYATKLEETNNDIKSFAYIVSHDLRAPLVNMQGFVTELGYDLKSVIELSEKYMDVIDEGDKYMVKSLLHEDIPESMNFIKTAVTKMDNLINSVLNISRLGRKELVFETIDTNEALETIATTFNHQLEVKEIELNIDPLPNVYADAVSISQIFSNILSNAIKFMSDKETKKISISSKPYEHGNVFIVEDTGIGMSESFRLKVFNLFSREEFVKTEGDGMGMAYVHRIVARHNGKIWCESEQGVGTKFYIYLPDKP